ncbi:MAG TPA: acyl carrier protein [Dysgonomonas sp.]|nr:acyl carrier protein [Dysgonomonas sp.]
MTDKDKRKEEIFIVLKQFISDIIGEDIVEELDVNPQSIFTKDLEMDSIEIVSFAEKVRLKYGDSVNFELWLSSMEFEQLMNLSLEDVTNFIVDAED